VHRVIYCILSLEKIFRLLSLPGALPGIKKGMLFCPCREVVPLFEVRNVYGTPLHSASLGIYEFLTRL
jgi:hypothetical protein